MVLQDAGSQRVQTCNHLQDLTSKGEPMQGPARPCKCPKKTYYIQACLECSQGPMAQLAIAPGKCRWVVGSDPGQCRIVELGNNDLTKQYFAGSAVSTASICRVHTKCLHGSCGNPAGPCRSLQGHPLYLVNPCQALQALPLRCKERWSLQTHVNITVSCN